MNAYEAQRRRRPSRQRAMRRYRDRYAARYPERIRCRKATQNAIRDGRLVRPPECKVEGCTERRTEAHHKDYRRPLDVEFLCRRHHRRKHAAER